MSPDDYEKRRGTGPKLMGKEELDSARAEAAGRQNMLRPLNERFDWLNGRGFSAKQVCAGAGISEETLTNWLRKQQLEVFSPVTGQGRARTFCLADIYMLAVVAEIAALTGQTKFAVLCVRRWFALEPLLQRLGLGEGSGAPTAIPSQAEVAAFYDDVVLDARHISPAAAHRDDQNAFYLIILRDPNNPGEFKTFCEQDPRRSWYTRAPAAAFINLTFLFASVDLRLSEVLGGPA